MPQRSGGGILDSGGVSTFEALSNSRTAGGGEREPRQDSGKKKKQGPKPMT